MQTISAEEYKKRYGQAGMEAFTQPAPQQGAISTAFKGGVDQFKAGVHDASVAKNPLDLLGAGLKQIAGGVGVAFSPLAPATQYIGKGIDYAANKISDIPAVQQFAMSDAGQKTAQAAEFTQNLSTDLGVAGGFKGLSGAKVPALGKPALPGAPPGPPGAFAQTVDNVGNYAASTAKDIIPGTDRMINHEVVHALDLTPGDLSNISKATGNDVGTWMADNNLIGKNKEETQGMITKFFDDNYKNVRSEIDKADTTRAPIPAESIPGYKPALTAIGSKLEGVPGVESDLAEVKTLLKNENPTLKEVQRAKELLDEHFSLYKVTGDVASGVEKQGLANLRSQLKDYIEQEVQTATGGDIRQMNNNVSTARSINDAITTRNPKGLTKANLRIGDLGIFGIGMAAGGPLVGAALLFGKKLIESPTVRLRIARYLDQLDDAHKARIKTDLESGKIPSEFNQFIKGRGSKPQRPATEPTGRKPEEAQ